MICISTLLLFLLSIGLTALVRWQAIRTSYLDLPNERSSHHTAIPKSGGMAMVLCFILLISVFYFNQQLALRPFLALLVGGVAIALIGFWDDHKNLSAKVRIIVHFTVAIWAVTLIGPIQGLHFGNFVLQNPALTTVLTVLSLVWLLNLYNFMDGIDGLAASEGVFVALAGSFLLYIHQAHTLATLCFLLAAIIAGFLMWNWAPAKIFMGDTGSCFLGFIFGVLLLISNVLYHISPWAWLILLGVFLADATYTLLMRVAQRYPFYLAHRNHAFQHASQRYHSHKKVVLTVALINILWLLPLSLMAAHWIKAGFYIALIAYIPLFIIAFYFRAGIKDGANSE